MQTASGHITVIQEARFRLMTDDGQGMLFTLAHGAGEQDSELHHFKLDRIAVTVQYEGEPDLSSAIAHTVRPR